jgi:hypothetical protein
MLLISLQNKAFSAYISLDTKKKWSIFCAIQTQRIDKSQLKVSTMKKLSILLFVVVSLSLFTNCSSTVENSLKIQNLASNDVFLNFRASLIQVRSGETVELKELPKGTFDYETIYEIPSGATSSTAEGEASGEFIVRAGTKILVVYTSTFIENTYTLFTSVTSSDDKNDEDPNPIGP